jgi:hypothetical protein
MPARSATYAALQLFPWSSDSTSWEIIEPGGRLRQSPAPRRTRSTSTFDARVLTVAVSLPANACETFAPRDTSGQSQTVARCSHGGAPSGSRVCAVGVITRELVTEASGDPLGVYPGGANGAELPPQLINSIPLPNAATCVRSLRLLTRRLIRFTQNKCRTVRARELPPVC